MEESLDRGRRTVTEPRLQPIRAQSLQEGLASSSTRQPRFRTWRSAGGPAEPRRSSIQVVKLRQDFLAHTSKNIDNRDEIDDLHSLRGPCRHLWIVVLSSYRVVDVGETAGFNHLR